MCACECVCVFHNLERAASAQNSTPFRNAILPASDTQHITTSHQPSLRLKIVSSHHVSHEDSGGLMGDEGGRVLTKERSDRLLCYLFVIISCK